jgi:hypothetical protein
MTLQQAQRVECPIEAHPGLYPFNIVRQSCGNWGWHDVLHVGRRLCCSNRGRSCSDGTTRREDDTHVASVTGFDFLFCSQRFIEGVKRVEVLAAIIDSGEESLPSLPIAWPEVWSGPNRTGFQVTDGMDCHPILCPDKGDNLPVVEDDDIKPLRWKVVSPEERLRLKHLFPLVPDAPAELECRISEVALQNVNNYVLHGPKPLNPVESLGDELPQNQSGSQQSNKSYCNTASDLV